eukprot:8861-Heterococcus_DN1.PRE.3
MRHFQACVQFTAAVAAVAAHYLTIIYCRVYAVRAVLRGAVCGACEASSSSRDSSNSNAAAMSNIYTPVYMIKLLQHWNI